MSVTCKRRARGSEPPPDRNAGPTAPAYRLESVRSLALSGVATLGLYRAHLLLGQSHVTASPLQSFIADPNVLFLLFMVAAFGIFLELSHPGATVPGVVGTIALVVFLIGAAALGPNWVGLVLMLVLIPLLALEVRLASHGLAALAGLASLVIGSLIFFDTGPGQSASVVNTYVVFGAAVGMGVAALVVIRYAVTVRHTPEISGTRGVVGQIGEVTVPLTPKGRVKVLGEDWAAELTPDAAILNMTVAATGRVRVAEFDGLKLIVEPVPALHEDILDLLLGQPQGGASSKSQPYDNTQPTVAETDQHTNLQ